MNVNGFMICLIAVAMLALIPAVSTVTDAPDATGLFHTQQTVCDTHGFSATAIVTETPQGGYTLTVQLAYNGLALDGMLSGYNVYADGAFLGFLDTGGWTGGGPAGGEDRFETTVTAPGTISQLELRPVWSDTGSRADAEESAGPENSIVLYRN